MAIIMDAKEMFDKHLNDLKREVKRLGENGITPRLAALLVGEDPVSKTYVSLKEKDCGKVGIESKVYKMYEYEPEVREKEVLNLLKTLNNDPDTHGILIQLPFPDFVNKEKVFENLSPKKDVDGLTPYNMGKLMLGEYDINNSLIPCTPKGTMMILDYYNVEISGKDAVIVGRSSLVGEPLRKLLQDRNATAVCTHTKTKNLDKRLKEADIIVTAAGRPPELVDVNPFRLNQNMISEGVIIISIGVRRNPANNKLVFDIDFEDVKEKASYITPNTGSTGIMTRAMLLKNTIIAAEM